MSRCIHCNAEIPLREGSKQICAKCFEREWEQLKERNQATLTQFLETDISAAFTLLETATLASMEKHADHAISALEKAQEALAAVRRLSRHIENRESMDRIQKRAGDLEEAIRRFEGAASSVRKTQSP